MEGFFLRKFKIIAYVLLVFAIIGIILTVYSNATQQNQESTKNEKVLAEIKYLDSKLVDLFNNMNNIETRNYRIYTDTTEESKSSEVTGEDNSSKQGENSKGSSASQSDKEKENGSSSNLESQKNETVENYEMTQAGILTSSKNIDWKANKNELELIYTSIPTITLDLYKINIAQDDILNFNKEIDNLTTSVETEDKQKTLNTLVKVYEYIPKFVQNVDCDITYKTIIETKFDIFKAYSNLETDNWKEINNNMTSAVEKYTTLLTSSEVNNNKQASVNKGYVMLNELKNVVDTKDKDVFLIKYKNLLEEINNM